VADMAIGGNRALDVRGRIVTDHVHFAERVVVARVALVGERILGHQPQPPALVQQHALGVAVLVRRGLAELRDLRGAQGKGCRVSCTTIYKGLMSQIQV
jgi:hypothetical protein